MHATGVFHYPFALYRGNIPMDNPMAFIVVAPYPIPFFCPSQGERSCNSTAMERYTLGGISGTVPSALVILLMSSSQAT